MENNIEMIENILNTERRNRRGNREIRFEVNSNYYEAVSKLLSDYKRVLKENEELKEDRDKFKKALGKRITYCNELEKDLFENCSNYVIPKQIVKDKIEELQKEYNKLDKQVDEYIKSVEKIDVSTYFENKAKELLNK